MKECVHWPGLKLASKNYRGKGLREAKEVAEDNAIMSSPPVDFRRVRYAVLITARSLAALETAVLKMLRAKR